MTGTVINEFQNIFYAWNILKIIFGYQLLSSKYFKRLDDIFQCFAAAQLEQIVFRYLHFSHVLEPSSLKRTHNIALKISMHTTGQSGGAEAMPNTNRFYLNGLSCVFFDFWIKIFFFWKFSVAHGFWTLS